MSRPVRTEEELASPGSFLTTAALRPLGAMVCEEGRRREATARSHGAKPQPSGGTKIATSAKLERSWLRYLWVSPFPRASPTPVPTNTHDVGDCQAATKLKLSIPHNFRFRRNRKLQLSIPVESKVAYPCQQETLPIGEFLAKWRQVPLESKVATLDAMCLKCCTSQFNSN